jgi:hypothetical protein
MNIIKLTYRVKSLAGDFDTTVECDFLNDTVSFLEVTDLVKKDLKTYNEFINELVLGYMNDYIDSYVNAEFLTVAEIRVNDWKQSGGYETLTDADKAKYNKFYLLLQKNIV